MQVLFHGDRSHNQCEVIWRCKDLLKEKYDIRLTGGDPERNFQAVHLILVHSPWWRDEFLHLDKKPIIILERIDGGQLSAGVRSVISHPHVKYVIKNTIYPSNRYYNETDEFTGKHVWRIHESVCVDAMREKSIGVRCRVDKMGKKTLLPDHYEKLKTGFSYAAYENLTALHNQHLRPWGDREYLLHFAGTTEYRELGSDESAVPWLEWHRKKAVEAIRSIPGDHICESSRTIPREEYLETMRRSKFVVSPWGLGEACWRDYEAVLCGCRVIKPDTSWVKTRPSNFYSSQAFVTCRPDFSDLHAVVQEQSRFPYVAAPIRDQLVEANTIEAISKRLAKIFQEAVQ